MFWWKLKFHLFYLHGHGAEPELTQWRVYTTITRSIDFLYKLRSLLGGSISKKKLVCLYKFGMIFFRRMFSTTYLKMRWAISKKMALFWDILSTQKAKFQIWYLSEFLVVLWPKYVVINKTTLGIHKNGQIKIFVKIPIGLCAQIWSIYKKMTNKLFLRCILH